MKHIFAALVLAAASTGASAQVTYMWGTTGTPIGSAVTVPGGVTYYYDQTYNLVGTTTSSNPAQAPKAGFIPPSRQPIQQPRASAWYDDDAEGEEE